MTEKKGKFGNSTITYSNAILIFFLKGLILGVFALFVLAEWLQ